MERAGRRCRGLGQYLRAVIWGSTWWLAMEKGGGGGAGGGAVLTGRTYGRYLVGQGGGRRCRGLVQYLRAVLAGGGGPVGGLVQYLRAVFGGRGEAGAEVPGAGAVLTGSAWRRGRSCRGLAPAPRTPCLPSPKYWRTNRTSYLGYLGSSEACRCTALMRLLAQCVRFFGCLAISCWPGFAEFHLLVCDSLRFIGVFLVFWDLVLYTA